MKPLAIVVFGQSKRSADGEFDITHADANSSRFDPRGDKKILLVRGDFGYKMLESTISGCGVAWSASIDVFAEGEERKFRVVSESREIRIPPQVAEYLGELLFEKLADLEGLAMPAQPPSRPIASAKTSATVH